MLNGTRFYLTKWENINPKYMFDLNVPEKLFERYLLTKIHTAKHIRNLHKQLKKLLTTTM